MRHLASEGDIHSSELARLLTRYMSELEKRAVLDSVIVDSHEIEVNVASAVANNSSE